MALHGSSWPWRVVTLIVTCLVAVSVAACGGGSANDDGDAVVDTRDDAATADPNAILRWGEPQGLTSFDPHRISTLAAEKILYPVYDRLVDVSADGEFMPGLAESWEYSDDGKTLTFHLREGVTFHDGEAFNAEAAKANIERAIELEGSSVAPLLANVAGVEAVDPATLEVALKAPDSSLLAEFSGTAGMMISPAAFDDPDLATKPVGAGMFEVVSYTPDSKIVYKPFAGYWDKEAVKVGGLEVLFMPEPETRANALLSGQIDATFIEPQSLSQVEAAGFNIQTRPTISTQVVSLNRATPQFKDIRVRQAISLALDREAMVTGLSAGHGLATMQHFPPDYFAYTEGLDSEFDPERAKELLAEAGVEDFPTFELVAGNVSGYPLVAEAVQEMLGKVGIKVKLKVLDAAQVGAYWFEQHRGQMIIGRWSGRADPLSTLAYVLTGPGSSNPDAIEMPEITDLLDTAKATFDPAERTELVKEISRANAEQAIEFFMYQPDLLLATREGVQNMEPQVLRTASFRGVSIAAN
jgi:peptide/nickel transport system substrate-binding protein